MSRWRGLPALTRTACWGVITLLVVGLLLWWSTWPRVVVMNTEAHDVTVQWDDARPIVVSPTTMETPYAGTSRRIPPGRHRWRTWLSRDGQPVDEREVSLQAGVTYLYAPVRGDHCFGIERRSYGRARLTGPRWRLLPPTQKFWPLPVDVDAWFVAPPPSDPNERASSGGIRVFVRQLRCGQEPGVVLPP